MPKALLFNCTARLERGVLELLPIEGEGGGRERVRERVGVCEGVREKVLFGERQKSSNYRRLRQ